MMKKTILASAFSFLIILSFGVATVYDQGEGDNTCEGEGQNSNCTSLHNPLKSGTDNLFVLLKIIINDILLPIGAVLAVMAFIFVGFKYVMAQGKPAELEKAHKALLYTAVGTGVLLGSWMLATVVCKTIAQVTGGTCPL